jgi:hypothetical protein
MKKIPIKAAKDIAQQYNKDQVIIVTFDNSTGMTNVVTYGKSKQDSVHAAQGGNKIKKEILKWPEEKCLDVPARSKWKWTIADTEISKDKEALLDVLEAKEPVWIEYHSLDEPFSARGFAVLELYDDGISFSVETVGTLNLKDCPKQFPLAGGFDIDPYDDSSDVKVYKCEKIK